MSDQEKQDQQTSHEPADARAQPGESSGGADQHAPATSLQAERDELYGRLQRVSADYQNYMRRAQQDSARAVELARGDMARMFIPVLDHFDNALDREPASEDAKALYAGVKIVRDELLKTLNQLGVERIEVKPGEPFDPEIHEAMLHQPAEGVEPNHVSLFMQPGYRLGSRTLRPAKVAVAPDA